jgi:hypothetical protein
MRSSYSYPWFWRSEDPRLIKIVSVFFISLLCCKKLLIPFFFFCSSEFVTWHLFTPNFVFD